MKRCESMSDSIWPICGVTVTVPCCLLLPCVMSVAVSADVTANTVVQIEQSVAGIFVPSWELEMFCFVAIVGGHRQAKEKAC